MKEYTAIVLAAGSGKRMNASVPKQYLKLGEKPVLYYSLRALEESPVSRIVLVVGAGDVEYCQKEIVEAYGFQKVCAVVEGGAERYHSVFQGLLAIKTTDFVLIHDGARPMLTQEIILRCMEEVARYQACVVGMPVKDTIKISDEEGFAKETPDRSSVWQIQTPQCFSYSLIFEAYSRLLKENQTGITDDAMVVERMTRHKVKLVQGSYQNLKITTPEDLLIAETYLLTENRK